MKSQYILISTLIIISILSYYFFQALRIEKNLKTDILEYVSNFENEIFYISKNLNKSYVLKFIQSYKNYLSLNNLQMSFTCFLFEKNYDQSIEKCINSNENCCYVFKNPVYIKAEMSYCNKEFLFKDQNLICICYNISKEDEFYVRFICV